MKKPLKLRSFKAKKWQLGVQRFLNSSIIKFVNSGSFAKNLSSAWALVIAAIQYTLTWINSVRCNEIVIRISKKNSLNTQLPQW